LNYRDPSASAFFRPHGAVHSIAAGPDGTIALSTWIVDKDPPIATPSHEATGVEIMKQSISARRREVTRHRRSPLITPTDLGTQASMDIARGFNAVLADVFALYLKTKNFHWHISGPHFRDYHLLLDEQADQLYAMTDLIAERIRKTGGSTLRSIGHISRLHRIIDNDADYIDPLDMLAELRDDNLTLAGRLRDAHDLVDEVRDIATASVVETWIDETERRTWFLFESSRRVD
jgi:starvation-inducible DNA-binding protein